MEYQHLLFDLVTADINIKTKIKDYSFVFIEEVRNSFKRNDVRSFSDLILVNLEQALKLRKLAMKEKLL